MELLKKLRKENPKLSFKEILKLGKKTYKKSKKHQKKSKKHQKKSKKHQKKSKKHQKKSKKHHKKSKKHQKKSKKHHKSRGGTDYQVALINDFDEESDVNKRDNGTFRVRSRRSNNL